jgi:hypothetical protein
MHKPEWFKQRSGVSAACDAAHYEDGLEALAGSPRRKPAAG